MKAHTQTPWRNIDSQVVLIHEDHGIDTWIADCHVGGASGDDMVANAAFIALAVNAHDDLVAALKSACTFVSRYESEHESNEALDCLTAMSAALANAGAA